MRVIINGLPLFAERLANELQKYDPNSSYHFFDTYNSKRAQLRFYLYLPFSDVVISMNGVSDNSGSLNLVLKRRKKLILQWMGTDVLLALERSKNGTIDRKYIDYAVNFTDSLLLQEELRSINVPVELLNFKSIKTQTLTQSFSRISVISYVPEARQTFYGMKKIIAVAKQFPLIDFHLYGLKTSDFPIPSNIQLHGWVESEKFSAELKTNPIFLRLTDHDGFSVSVIEALSYGCEVIATIPFELCHFAKDEAAIIEQTSLVINKLEQRNLARNNDSIEAMNKKFNPSVIFPNYSQKLKEIAGK